MNNDNWGSLWLQSAAAFARPLSSDEQVRQALAVLSETPLPAASDTDPATITNCVEIGTLYKVEARTLVWHALLRFDPGNPTTGDYEFHLPSQQLHETGTVHSVSRIEGRDRYFRMFAPTADFPTRFLVVTKDTRGRLRVWHIGILHSRYFESDDAELRS